MRISTILVGILITILLLYFYSLGFLSFLDLLCSSFIGLHIRGLAHAASGYHRVLEENRKLYNQVQDLKGNYRLHNPLNRLILPF